MLPHNYYMINSTLKKPFLRKQMDASGIFKRVVKYHASVKQGPILIIRVYGHLLTTFLLICMKSTTALLFAHQHAKHAARLGKEERSKLFDEAVPDMRFEFTVTVMMCTAVLSVLT